METKRQYNAHNQRSGIGRSYFYICCPWCNAQTKVFNWSFAGHGKKKCIACEALHKPDGFSHLDLGLATLKQGDRLAFVYFGFDFPQLKGHAFEGEVDTMIWLTSNEPYIKFWPIRSSSFTPAAYVPVYYIRGVVKLEKKLP